MITVLLRLAPDMEDKALHGIAVEDSEFSVGGGEILLQSTSEAIFSRSKRIFEELRAFTSQLTNCCLALVLDHVQKKHDQGNGEFFFFFFSYIRKKGFTILKEPH